MGIFGVKLLIHVAELAEGLLAFTDVQNLMFVSSPAADALEQSLDPAMTEWERSREQEEFVRACILYRPSTSLLSSRFTRAKKQDDDDAVEVNRDQEVRTLREVPKSCSTVTSSYISHNAPALRLRFRITNNFGCFHAQGLNGDCVHQSTGNS